MYSEWDDTPWGGVAVPTDDWSIRLRRIREERLQARAIDSFTDYPGWTEQMLRVQGLRSAPWRAAGLREALGVPAIFRSVSLIANTTGMLSLEAFRKGRRLDDDERPRLIVRPDPFRIPREFFRDTAYCLATRGEAWWWIAKRDIDGLALSLIVVPPWEVTVERNERDLRFPIIKWREQEMSNFDMLQITFMREPGELRGFGPLQMCGAAVSVAVEAQEWAANFFGSGGAPSIGIKSAMRVNRDEANALREQWMTLPGNTPKVWDDRIEEVKEFKHNEQGAQMLDAREHQNGDAARMFGIPGSLLDYGTPGSSLTYQNIEQEFTKFLTTCLQPNYLIPIEQTISDLLTRSLSARFDVDALRRADMKTRGEFYDKVVPIGVYTVEEARQKEGLEPGDTDTAPVPLALPAAFPDRLPIQQRSAEPVRCTGTRMLRGILRPCNKLLAEQAPFIGRCERCGKTYEAAA